jgi:hypothetical protein
VSYKQLGELECEGWLLQRARAAAGASWSRAWFALKGTALYGFSNAEVSVQLSFGIILAMVLTSQYSHLPTSYHFLKYCTFVIS